MSARREMPVRGRTARATCTSPDPSALTPLGCGAKLTRRRFLAGLGAALVLTGVGARIWWVNEHAVARPEVIPHEMGEWVALDGAFTSANVSERTQGYAVCVTSAEVMSRNEYVGRHATDESTTIEGLDEPAVVCVSAGIRNEDSDGGLAIAAMYLVPVRKNEYFRFDSDLFLSSETTLRESGAMMVTGFSIRQGTEYETCLPYIRQGGTVETGGIEVNEAYLEPIHDTEFDLILTNLPVRHVIRVCMA